jgi:hypothetical protein
MELSVQELEAAINYWRMQRPARGNELALSPEVNVLAPVYALMIYHHTMTVALGSLNASARDLLLAWQAQHRQP